MGKLKARKTSLFVLLFCFCRLKPLDIEFMKQLHNKVNIVPVIAKADVLTKKEMQRLKKKVMEEIEANGIRIYSLPECDSDEDEEYKEQVRLNLIDSCCFDHSCCFVSGASIETSSSICCMRRKHFIGGARTQSTRSFVSVGCCGSRKSRSL